LIAVILDDQDLAYLLKMARSLGLAALVQVHDAEEMERVLRLDGVQMIGINNRDLSTFQTDLATHRAAPQPVRRPDPRQQGLLVSESGLFQVGDQLWGLGTRLTPKWVNRVPWSCQTECDGLNSKYP
jgi:indole-3-glycerol phosphate synthase